MKYRIIKSVSYDKKIDEKPNVHYFIQEKFLWQWNTLFDVLGSKYSSFTSVEEAEKALQKLIEFKKMIDSDGQIVKVVKDC